jgi:hypothetical protein
LNTKIQIQMVEQLHYCKASTELELRDTASIELELLLVSSCNVLPLDSSAKISMKSITQGSWFYTRNKGGLQILEAKVLANISTYTGNWNDFSELGRKVAFAKNGRWRGGLNIVLQEKNIGETLLESTGQEHEWQGNLKMKDLEEKPITRQTYVYL